MPVNGRLEVLTANHPSFVTSPLRKVIVCKYGLGASQLGLAGLCWVFGCICGDLGVICAPKVQPFLAPFCDLFVVLAEVEPNAETATEIQNKLYGLPLEAVSADPAIVLGLQCIEGNHTPALGVRAPFPLAGNSRAETRRATP